MENFFSHENIYKKDINLDIPKEERSLDILYNAIARINFTDNGKKFLGTGFFIKFHLNYKFRYFLIACNNIIDEKCVKSKISIIVNYGKFNEEEKLDLKLDINERHIKLYNKPYDISLIELIMAYHNFRYKDINAEPFINFNLSFCCE